MSVDVLGARAADDLRVASESIDVERALADTLQSGRRSSGRTPTLVVAVVVLALILAWAGSRVLTGEQSAPPLNPAPQPAVGGGLSVPVEVTVPEGWRAIRDTDSVLLVPSDGSDRSITLVGQPVWVFESPDYHREPLRSDLVIWTTTHSDLVVTYQFGIDGPDFAWTGTEMELALRAGRRQVPLVPLPGGYDPLAISGADRTFLWDVIYLTDSPPLLVASRSFAADDPTLKAGRDALLKSLTTPSPSNP